MKSRIFDFADTWLFRAWLASLVGFVLAARADSALADWLLPLAMMPLTGLMLIFAIALIRLLLGR